MLSSQSGIKGFNPTSPLLFGALAAGLLLLSVFHLLPAGMTDDLAGHWSFLGLGALGAIFANSTGAGGGVVFIPTFAQLGFTEAQAVATSFGIQCFGMTAGALTWTHFYRTEQKPHNNWQSFSLTVALCATASVLGLWTVFAADVTAPAAVAPMFAAFSLFLGVSILLTVMRTRGGGVRTRLAPLDFVALPIIAYGGGIVTAWLSVGVGELVAFYLILRRYDVTLSVAAAVVISAISVWSAAPEQLLFNQQAIWQVVAFAGPGAVLGGLIARHLVLRLGARRLKLFFGSWLLMIGLVEFIPLG